MKNHKFNKWEQGWITYSLDKLLEEWVKDIEKSEAEGKRPFITADYLRSQMEHLIWKVNQLTENK